LALPTLSGESYKMPIIAPSSYQPTILGRIRGMINLLTALFYCCMIYPSVVFVDINIHLRHYLEDAEMASIYVKIELFVSLLVIGILLIVYSTTAIEEFENLAFEMPVTGSGGAGQGTYELLTDGKTESDPYLGGPTWVQVDLEEEFLIDTIQLWHYWSDGRTYHDNKVAVSDIGDFLGEETVVFDTTAGDEEYPETAEGKTITFEPVIARYVRAWIGGSTANEWSHWVELQVFFQDLLKPVSPGEKLPTTWGKIKSP